MKICPSCKHTTQADAMFCPICGTTMTDAPAPTPPPVQPTPAPTPVYTPYPTPPAAPPEQSWQPAPPAPPAQPAPSKGKIIAGMVLAISGLECAVCGVLLGFIFTVMGAAVSEMQVAGIGSFVYGIIFTIFSLPLSIIGFAMSKKCVNAGSTSNMCRLGVKFGIAGMILSGIALIFSFVGLGQFIQFMDSSYYYY